MRSVEAEQRLFDISVPLHTRLPVWPGSPGLKVEELARIGPASFAHVSKIELDVHTGTHVDAPRHFVVDGDTVERLPLDVLVGPVRVAELDVERAITDSHLEALRLPPKTRRLLLRTSNSDLWSTAERDGFRRKYCALTAEAARWVVGRRLELVGIDYLSVQLFDDGPETHQILLGSGVVVVEGLDLSAVPAGDYELFCLPLLLPGLEAAPARVVLRRI